MLSLVLCGALCVVFVWLKCVRGSNAPPLPPVFPGGLPVFGHTFMVVTNIWGFIKNGAADCAKQGGVTHTKVAGELYYLIADHQDALTVANACTTKHFGFDFAKAWLGDGLLTSSGDLWKQHRKLLNPAFSLPVIHSFLNVFNSQSKRLLSDVDPHCGKGPFDHCIHLRNTTLETLLVGTFGINPIEDRNFTLKFMKAADEIMKMATDRVTKFWLHSNLFYWLCGLKKKELEIVKTLNEMTDQVMQRKKAAMKNGTANNMEHQTTGIKYRPFLDLLLELSTDGTLSDKEIRNEIDTTIVAGFETSSNQLTYTLLLLGVHPEVQKKLYEELLEVLGPDRDIEKDDVNKLVYTNAVLMECLRVYPSVPALLRYIDRDVKLKNYTLRAGSQCFIYPLSTHLDQAWGTEAERFKPERWFDDNVRCNSKEFAAFGLGKRACIGRTYAMISMKVILAHFIRRYRVTADMSKLQLHYDFVLQPLSGYEISIDRRIC